MVFYRAFSSVRHCIMLRSVTTPPESATASAGIRAGGWWHESDDGSDWFAIFARGAASAAGRPGVLLRSAKPRRADRFHHLRPQHRLLHRPDREEAAPSVLSRHGRPFLRHAGLQPGLQVLPELDHVASRATSRRPAKQAPPQAIAAAAQQLGCRSVAFTYNDPIIWAEYAIDTAKACRALASRRWRSPRATSRRPPASGVLRGHGRRQRRPERIHRAILPRYCGGQLEARARHAPLAGRSESQVWLEITNLIIPQANDSPDEIDADVPVDCRRVGIRRAVALLCVPSRFQTDRSRPDTTGPAFRGVRNRPCGRVALHLHRKRGRSESPKHLLPRLRPGGHPPRRL